MPRRSRTTDSAATSAGHCQAWACALTLPAPATGSTARAGTPWAQRQHQAVEPGGDHRVEALHEGVELVRGGLDPGVPREHHVQTGDCRIGWVDDRHTDRDPPAAGEMAVEPAQLLAVQRSADEVNVRVPFRRGVVQGQRAGAKQRVPRHLAGHACALWRRAHLLHAQHITRGCLAVQEARHPVSRTRTGRRS